MIGRAREGGKKGERAEGREGEGGRGDGRPYLEALALFTVLSTYTKGLVASYVFVYVRVCACEHACTAVES